MHTAYCLHCLPIASYCLLLAGFDSCSTCRIAGIMKMSSVLPFGMYRHGHARPCCWLEQHG